MNELSISQTGRRGMDNGHAIISGTPEACENETWLGLEHTECILGKRSSLRIYLRDKTLELWASGRKVCRIPTASMAVGCFAELSRVPKDYLRHLMSRNPELAAECFNDGICRRLPDRKYAVPDRKADPVICVAMAKKSDASREAAWIFPADHPVLIPPAYFLRAATLLGGQVEGLSDTGIKCVGRSMSSRKLEIRFTIGTREIDGEVDVDDAVEWGFIVTVDFLEAEIRVAPFIFRLVCKNGMVVPEKLSEFRVSRLPKLPSWRNCFGNELLETRTLRGLLDRSDLSADAVAKKIARLIMSTAVEVAGKHEAANRTISWIMEANRRNVVLEREGVTREEALGEMFSNHSISLSPGQLLQVIALLDRESKGNPPTLWNVVNALTDFAHQVRTHARRRHLELGAYRLMVALLSAHARTHGNANVSH